MLSSRHRASGKEQWRSTIARPEIARDFVARHKDPVAREGRPDNYRPPVDNERSSDQNAFVARSTKFPALSVSHREWTEPRVRQPLHETRFEWPSHNWQFEYFFRPSKQRAFLWFRQ